MSADAGFPSAAALSLDVVLLAGGGGTDLLPLTGATMKPLVPLCNKPLVWYGIRAWMAVGVRRFFVCAPAERKLALELFLGEAPDLRGVSFTFVSVRPSGDDQDSDSVDALRALAAYKRKLPPGHPDAAPRDFVVQSCDTVMAGVELERFVEGFYTSFSSAAVLLHRDERKKVKERDCVALEDFEDAEEAGMQQHRMHYLCPADSLDDGRLKLNAAFLARRSNITFTTDFADAHVYILRHWVLGFVEFQRDIASVRYDLIPLLASKQLPSVNAAARTVATPTERIGAAPGTIPVHWALGDPDTPPHAAPKEVARLNSMAHMNPPAWDELRVTATVLNPQAAGRLVRVTTLWHLRELTRECLGAGGSSLASLLAPFLEYEEFAVRSSADAAGRVISSAVLSLPPPESVIANSAVGRNVTMGKGSSVRNSIVCDGCVIGDGVRVENSIICPETEVTEDVRGCTVSAEAGEFEIQQA